MPNISSPSPWPSSSTSSNSQNIGYHSLPSISPDSSSSSSSHNLNVFYFNARSLLPKLDDLKLLCSAHSPDIICIVESWVSSDISNLEISLPNFLCFHLDCNRHGGSIVVFGKSHLSVSPLLLPSNNLEFLPLQITCHYFSFTLGTFYCPPELGSIS